jgi:hypothetical protein
LKHFSKRFSVPTAPVPAVTDPVEVPKQEASVLEEVPKAAAVRCPMVTIRFEIQVGPSTTVQALIPARPSSSYFNRRSIPRIMHEQNPNQKELL